MQRDDESKKKPVGAAIADAALFAAARSEKKSDSILDIPKIPFNAERHQKALKLGGEYIPKEYKTHIELVRLHAPKNKPGSGFGTAKFRETVKRTEVLGCAGQITTEATTSYGSPHLFYLYMGMAPDSSKRSYVKEKYGPVGVVALAKLAKCENWSVEELKKVENKLDAVKDILSNELKIPLENVSLEDIIKNKDFLLNLKEKLIDYISEVFIPNLLEILAADPKEKYPDTTSLRKVFMHLTKEGYARWKYAIENNLEFVPFRNLEHLNLSPDQKVLLEEILAKRAGVVSKP